MRTHPRILATFVCLLLAACGGSDTPGAEAAAQSGTLPGEAAPASEQSAVRSGTTLLGTIEATVDGERRTWYVVSEASAGRRFASGMWLGDDPGDRMVMVGGFDTPDPPIDTFERAEDGTPLSYGDYQGSVLTLHVSEAAGPFPVSIAFAPDGLGVPGAGALYQHRATVEDIMESTHWLVEGRIDVETLTIETGGARIAGTFSGTFRSQGLGDTRLTDGRFDVRGLPNVEELLR
jgi:hypothetical protein